MRAAKAAGTPTTAAATTCSGQDAAPPLFIVLNCGAGSGGRAEARAAIGEVLTAAGREHHFALVDDVRQLPAAARRAVSLAVARHGLAVAAGGDGTINALVQAALGSDCLLGVLPQGTFNYFSRALGIPDDTVQATRLLLEGRPQPVQVGLVNDRAFVVNASVGLYPRLLEHREFFKRQYGRSRLVALWAALATMLRGHRPMRLVVEHGGVRRTIRTATLFVANNRLQLERLGIEEADELDKGLLVALTPRPLGTAAMLWLAVKGVFGRLGQADEVNSFAFRCIEVSRVARWGRRRIKVATDGEVAWLDAPLVFRVADKPVFVLTPGPAAAERSA